MIKLLKQVGFGGTKKDYGEIVEYMIRANEAQRAINGDSTESTVKEPIALSSTSLIPEKSSTDDAERKKENAPFWLQELREKINGVIRYIVL